MPLQDLNPRSGMLEFLSYCSILLRHEPWPGSDKNNMNVVTPFQLDDARTSTVKFYLIRWIIVINVAGA